MGRVKPRSIEPATGPANGWHTSYSLRHGRFGSWSLLSKIGSSTPTCFADGTACRTTDRAGIAIGWRWHRLPITLFAGLDLVTSSLRRQGGATHTMRVAPTGLVGLIVALPSLLDVVKMMRGIPNDWAAVRRTRAR